VEDYPVYLVHAEAGAETGVDVEMRVLMGAGGGLPGMASPDAVVKALAAAIAEAGATVVFASVQTVQTATVPTS
jgi:hypothetical protein